MSNSKRSQNGKYIRNPNTRFFGKRAFVHLGINLKLSYIKLMKK